MPDIPTDCPTQITIDNLLRDYSSLAELLAFKEGVDTIYRLMLKVPEQERDDHHNRQLTQFQFMMHCLDTAESILRQEH